MAFSSKALNNNCPWAFYVMHRLPRYAARAPMARSKFGDENASARGISAVSQVMVFIVGQNMFNFIHRPFNGFHTGQISFPPIFTGLAEHRRCCKPTPCNFQEKIYPALILPKLKFLESHGFELTNMIGQIICMSKYREYEKKNMEPSEDNFLDACLFFLKKGHTA